MQKAAVRSAPRVAANRSLLRPQPLLQRSRTAAVSVSAAAPAQAVKITIQGRRLPVSPGAKLSKKHRAVYVTNDDNSCKQVLHNTDIDCTASLCCILSAHPVGRSKLHFEHPPHK